MSSESKEITVASLSWLVQREVQSPSLQEVDPRLFDDIAAYLGNLRKQEFDGLENKVRDALIGMSAELASMLVGIRLEKGLRDQDFANMLGVERYILDSQEERRERTDLVLAAVLGGRPQLLESVAASHRARPVPVRFLRDADEFVGADFERYGPFRAEDIATIPYDNAQALVLKEVAARIRTAGSSG